MRSRENPIRKTTTKGGNYRPTKSGAGMTKKKIPAGKKGKGLRALKKKAPQVAKRMGYKKGMKVK